MNTLNINVIDGIMGSGKSSGMINTIKYIKKENPNEKFLIIVPYLDEVERYSEQLKGFKKLIRDNPPKRLTLKKYLQEKKDIICTHQLFLQNPDLITEYAQGYNLVIDEALNSLISNLEFPTLINSNRINTDIEITDDKTLSLKKNAPTYSFNNDDINFLFNSSYLQPSPKHENLVIWNKYIKINSIYSCLKDYFTQNDVYRLEAKHELEDSSYYYIGLFPIKVFQSFKKIYVMTYLWDAQLMKYYFDFYKAQYQYLYPIEAHPINKKANTAHLENKEYMLSDNLHLYQNVENPIKYRAIHGIHIPGYKIEDDKIVKNMKSRNTLYSFWNKNKNAKHTITLSHTYYKNLDNPNDKIVTILKENINKFAKDNIPEELKKDKKIIWSVFDCAKDIIKTNCKYIDDTNYVPINAKATNEYKDANVLIYLVNRYINPYFYNFIRNYCPNGCDFDEDLYALSELVQWIWRSAIRDNKPICIYIASERMLNILLDWLNSTSDEDIIEQENNINFINKNIVSTVNSTTNAVDTEIKSPPIQTSTFLNATKRLKDEKKFKQKCIEEIEKYINSTLYQTNEFLYLLNEKLEDLNDTYSYEVIFSAIQYQSPDLILAISLAIKNSSSEEDILNSLFELVEEHLENINK